jgi:HlyD family secretion protein
MKTALAIIAVLAAAVAVMMSSRAESRSIGPISTHTISRNELLVTITEQGTLESSNNTEIKCRVRGDSIITSVVVSGTHVEQGDVLVMLETLLIEEEISERTKFYHLANAAAARSAADVERAEIAIEEYKQGRFVSQLATLQKDLAIAESRMLSAKNRLSHSQMMARSEYVSELEVEEKQFAVSQADLNVKLTQTQIDVLKEFTRREELVRLEGELNASRATHEADVERAVADQNRLERAREELEYCTIKANRSGMVIYPTGEEWKNTPEVEEGATVHKDQVLLLMPDLTQMQVKVGIHESVVDRVSPGLEANITLNRRQLDGELASVASVAKPAGWWTGNVVKYDAIVQLATIEGLKPGMSVEVELIVARHENVLTIPTSAVIETTNGHACWVMSGETPIRRSLNLGDHSDMFIVVEDGLKEAEEVVLDPLANIKEAQIEAARSLAKD